MGSIVDLVHLCGLTEVLVGPAFPQVHTRRAHGDRLLELGEDALSSHVWGAAWARLARSKHPAVLCLRLLTHCPFPSVSPSCPLPLLLAEPPPIHSL